MRGRDHGEGFETRREPGPYALPALRGTSHIHVGRPWGLITDILSVMVSKPSPRSLLCHLALSMPKAVTARFKVQASRFSR